MNMRTASANHLFLHYNGTGKVPEGQRPVSRGERGVYLADEGLRDAVRTAVALEKPLLVTGEPGTGKTLLAWSVASELGLGNVLEFHTRSDNKGLDLLYQFDHIRRFFDAQTKEVRALDPSQYVTFAALGRAILEADSQSTYAQKVREQLAQADDTTDTSPGRRVVLIDEIDKAPRDFPNDLLDEFDRMSFSVKEKPELHFRASFRPIVIITSNSERQLPDPFLRRCVFHYIEFPGKERLREILHQRIDPQLPATLVEAAVDRFTELRKLGDSKLLEKKPATAELEAWVRMLILAGIPAQHVVGSPLGLLPHVGALVKTIADRRTLRDCR